MVGHTVWLSGYSDGFSVLMFLFFLIVLTQTLMGLLSGRLFRAS